MKFIKGTIIRFGEAVSIGTGLGLQEDSTGLVELITSGSVGGATTLNDLTDVTITAASAGPPADFLKYNGSQWVDDVIAAADLPTVTETKGGTGETTYTVGDILYSDASNSLARLAGNTTNRKFLMQSGTGAASAAPSWDTLRGTDLPTHVHAAGDITTGTLAVARGGTNIGSYTVGDILYASGTTTLLALAKGANGTYLQINNGLPGWGALNVGAHTHTAGQIDSGTFPAGRYTFIDTLVVQDGLGVGNGTLWLPTDGIVMSPTGRSDGIQIFHVSVGNYRIQNPGTGNLAIISSGSMSFFADSFTFADEFQTSRWQIDASGNFVTPTDNTYDVGALGATRPKFVYIASGMVIGSDTGHPTGGYGSNVRINNIARIGAAVVGTWPFSSGYMFIAHESHAQNVNTNYAMIQDTNGDTFVNAKTGRGLYLRTGNLTAVQIDSNQRAIFGSDPGGAELARFGGAIRLNDYLLVSGTGKYALLMDATEAQYRLQKTGASANLSYWFNNGANVGLQDSTNARTVEAYEIATNKLRLYYTGGIVIPNSGTGSLMGRNNANNNEYSILGLDSGDNLNIGRDDSVNTIQLFGTTVIYDDAASPIDIFTVYNNGVVAVGKDLGGSRTLRVSGSTQVGGILYSPSTVVYPMAMRGRYYSESDNSGGSAGYAWRAQAAGADQKMWDVLADVTPTLKFRLLTDTESAANTWLQVNRGSATNITSVVFPSGSIIMGPDVGTSSRLHVSDGATFTPDGSTNNNITLRNVTADKNWGLVSFTDGILYVSRNDASNRVALSTAAFYPGSAGLMTLGAAGAGWGDLYLNTIGKFKATPTGTLRTDDVWSYNGTEWSNRFIQTNFAQGDVVSAVYSGTYASYVNTVTIPSGSLTDPVTAPTITGIYKGMIVDMSAYGALPAQHQFVTEWSIDSGSTWMTGPVAIVGTGNKIVHSNLTLGRGYRYRYRIRGTGDSNPSPQSIIGLASGISETNAFGLVVASQISTANLSAIASDIGDITAGILRNQANTAGIRLSDTYQLPQSWANYIDLMASGIGNVFQIGGAVRINSLGNAVFSGIMSASSLKVIGSTVLSGISIVPSSGSLTVRKLQLSDTGIWGDSYYPKVIYDVGGLYFYGDWYSGTTECMAYKTHQLTEGTGLVARLDSGWSDPIGNNGYSQQTLANDGGYQYVTLASGQWLVNIVGDPTPGSNISAYDMKYTVKMKLTINATNLTDPDSSAGLYVAVQYSTDGGNNWVTGINEEAISIYASFGSSYTETITRTFTATPQNKTDFRVRLKHVTELTPGAGEPLGNTVTSTVQVYETVWQTDNYYISWTSGSLSRSLSRRGLVLDACIASGIAQPHLYLQPHTILLPSGSGTFPGEVWFDGFRQALTYSNGKSSIKLTNPTTKYKFQKSGATWVGIGASAPTITGTPSSANSPTGIWGNLTTGATTGNQSVVSPATFDMTRHAYNPIFRARIRTSASVSSIRFWIGLTSVSQTANSDTATGSCIMFRGGTNWVGVCRDGATQSTTANIAPVVADTTYDLMIRVISEDGTARFSINGGPEVVLGTNLPATTVDLGPEIGVTTTAAGAKSLLGAYFEVDNDDC